MSQLEAAAITTGTSPAPGSARVPAGPETPEARAGSALSMRRPADQHDPLHEVVERVRRDASDAVDALQVAALLEAEGVTDQAARTQYGFGDVFGLADAVYRRLGGLHVAVRLMSPAPSGWRQAWRDASHGVLYLLPSAVFPAVLAFVERPSINGGLVVPCGAGWLLAGVASWFAYQLLGLGDGRSAGRVLLWFTAAGLLAAAMLGAGMAAATDGSGRVIAFAVGAMAYQMSSMLLTFYRREAWLAATMAPAAATGLGYALTGQPSMRLALTAGAVSVGVTLVLAVLFVVRSLKSASATKQTHPLRTLLGGRVTVFTLVVVYTALSAAYLLHSQVPYLLDRFDILVTAVPLMLGMGIVEWRARRFTEMARELLLHVHYPREFIRRIWLLLVANVGACTGAAGLGALALLVIQDRVTTFSTAAATMAAGYAILAGAYMVTFVLAGHGRYGSLSGALAAALAIHLVGSASVRVGSDTLTDTTVFLISAVVLQVLLLLAMIPVANQVWRHA
jgi:hypothetical protein